MAKYIEKQLDSILEAAFKTNPAFVQWFLNRTKFAGAEATYRWSRSDHPWCEMDWLVVDPSTGATTIARRQGETDILVVLSLPDSRNVALHIENKMATGSFTPLQPEMYEPRARLWLNKQKYGSYSDFETVLVAPRVFVARNPSASLFHRFVPHEDIARWLPEFQASPATK